MNGEHWFDTLNKTMVRSASRRAALRSAGTLAAGLLLGWAPGAAVGKKKQNDCPNCGALRCGYFRSERAQCACQRKCKRCRIRSKFCTVPNGEGDLRPTCCFEHQTCCGNECVDTDTDPNHCRGCDKPCSPGKVCVDGDCVCRDGLTLCGEICRDTMRDEHNCGPCDRRCGPGERCVDGACVCPVQCPPERACCPDPRNGPVGVACVYLWNNQDHCGACGNACGAYPQACCGGACKDTSTDNEHCGHCFNRCRPDQTCRPNPVNGYGSCYRNP